MWRLTDHNQCRRRSGSANRRGGWVLLETVIATGLLILGLTILGGELQDSHYAVKRSELKIRALAMAEMQLAHLDTGLIEIRSVDDEEEGDFGPRFLYWGWRITTEETATEELYRLQLETLYWPVREDYEEEMDYDEAEVLNTFYVFRAKPKPLDFAEDFGLREDELEELATKLGELGIDGLDPEKFDPAILAKLDLEELMEVLPSIMDAFGMDVSQFVGQLPQEIQDAIREAGVGLGAEEEGEGEER